MRNRVLLAAGTVAVFVPALLLAQQRPAQRSMGAHPMMMSSGEHREGGWELTAGVGGMVIGKYPAGNTAFAPGGVLRAGYVLDQSWSFGVGLYGGYGSSATRGVGKTAYLSPFASATWTPDIDRVTSPFVTAGLGLFSRKSGSASSAAGHVGVGVRHTIGENLAVRGELGVELFSFKPKNGASLSSGAGLISVGLSYFMGGGPPKDTDGDGVPDKMDRCPSTPTGAVVDARGCPVDSDHDGVPNGIDKCANTPSGVHVDAMGCPVDADHDGVADYMDRCANTPSGVSVDANGCPVDSDGDGVPDYQDRCANTPHGAPVDANGCPKDSDGDGVPDYLDRCPNTPSGATVDANGCPVDTDKDGVPDYLDRCPGTAPGTQVDANGCPVQKDTDGDGVVDPRDKCPNTAHGTPVFKEGTYAGCPMHALPAVGAPGQILRGVNFRSVRRQEVVSTGREVLDTIAETMKTMPNTKWELDGYTDSRGSLAINNRLSRERAQAVKDYLVGKGVSASDLTVVGHGPQNPIASNRTARGRAENRRIEVKRVQ